MPNESGKYVGRVLILLLLAFAGALWFDVGGINAQMAKLISDAPRTAASGPNPPAATAGTGSASAQITQAWFLNAPGYEGADAERKSNGARMVVYFHKHGCDLCRRVEHELFASAEMKQLLAGVVKVRVDIEAGPRELRLAQQFGAGETPALIAFGADGLARKVPLQNAGGLLSGAQLAAECER